MFNIYFKQIIVFIVFILLACSSEVKKDIDLQKFLPFESNATKYTFTVIGTEQENTFFTEYILSSKNNNCVMMHSYVWTEKNGKKSVKKRTKDILFCIKNDEIIGDNYYIYYKNSKKWYIDISSIGVTKKIIKAKCNLLSFDKKNIFSKDREILHTQCKYKIKDILISNDYFIAEGLGLYKITSKSSLEQFRNSKVSVMEIINIK